ncbi:MAG: phosphate propanoyltransferase [Clostridiales bacterium]|nr:phosphate propanoyltransferase [Clostridiales bacterium]
MDGKRLQDEVLRLVLCELARGGDLRVPVNASNRHIHLSQEAVDALFGPGYQLRRLRDLVQPGQYACHEQVTMQTAAGELRLRVVGPVRRATQIELSMSEAVRMKVTPMVRLSGDIQGTPGCLLLNGTRRYQMDQGVIVAARHVHLSPEEAQCYGVKQGDRVALEVPGPRALRFEDVIVRSGPGHVLEAHLDREEANACGLADGQLGIVHVTGRAAPQRKPPQAVPPVEKPEAVPAVAAVVCQGKGRALLGEEDVLVALHRGIKALRIPHGTIITPLARDAAWEKGIELIEEQAPTAGKEATWP